LLLVVAVSAVVGLLPAFLAKDEFESDTKFVIDLGYTKYSVLDSESFINLPNQSIIITETVEEERQTDTLWIIGKASASPPTSRR
jgi:hypothetical protein